MSEQRAQLDIIQLWTLSKKELLELGISLNSADELQLAIKNIQAVDDYTHNKIRKSVVRKLKTILRELYPNS